METADLIPVWGLLLATLVIEAFTGSATLPVLELLAAGLMAYVNRTEVDIEVVVERMAQGMGIVFVLYVLTRIPNRVWKFFSMSTKQ